MLMTLSYVNMRHPEHIYRSGRQILVSLSETQAGEEVTGCGGMPNMLQYEDVLN
jgi:hypothetical protein